MSTVPEKFAASMPVITWPGRRPGPTQRSESKICAITQTRERSATVKAGVVLACSNWPGLISFSTTVPARGERMIAFDAGGRLARLDVLDGLGIDVQRDQRLAARRRGRTSALAASVSAWSASRWETP